MKNNAVKINVISVIAALIFAITLFLAFRYAPNGVSLVPEPERELVNTTYDYDEATGEPIEKNEKIVIGKDIAAVDVSDVAETGLIAKANYIPNKFVSASDYCADSQIIDLTEPFDFAPTGTIYFVFLPPDPSDENYDKKKAIMEKYRVGDDWVVSLCLPQIFAAANVYNGSSLNNSSGVIEKYDFIEHTVYYSFVTGEFSAETDKTIIDLRFSTKADLVSDDYYSARTVTVHYQAKQGFAGVKTLPMIGLKTDLSNFNRSSRLALGVAAITALLLVAVYVVLSVSKRTASLVPDVVALMGILCAVTGYFAFSLPTGAPYFWNAVSRAFPFLVYIGAISGLTRRIENKLVKYPPCALCSVGFVLAFIEPYVSFSACEALFIVRIVVSAVIFASITGFAAFLVVKGKREDVLSVVTAVLTIAAGVGSFLVSTSKPSFLSATFWISVAIIAVYLVKFIINTSEIETRNRCLTRNLQTEVKLQTEEIRGMIKERDDLIRFVSHDVRKTVSATANAVNSAILHEKDEEQLKLLQMAKHYNDSSLDNLTEVAGYAKFNYMAEASVAVNVADICKTAYESCAFDCEANGILLKNECFSSATAYAKPKGLENVLVNLIMNAIEHAQCKNIRLSVKEGKETIQISVSDDGKGIADGIELFSPYATDKTDENCGVGLFLCQNIVRSMGGTLSFVSTEGTIFIVTLRKA